MKSEMVKDVHVVPGKQKRTSKNTEEDDMCKKQLIFWELPYWKDIDVHHSIDVMHVEKNVCESLLGTLLNIDGKTRDHRHAQADLKKIGIRPELWLDDSVKGIELPTSCITLSKHEKEFCGFFKKCISTICLLDKCLNAYFISRSKGSSRCDVS
jgi:hypothetical protein